MPWALIINALVQIIIAFIKAKFENGSKGAALMAEVEVAAAQAYKSQDPRPLRDLWHRLKAEK